MFPVTIPRDGEPYMTLIPGRSQERKSHPTLEEAKDALRWYYWPDRFREDMALYKWAGVEWLKMFEVSKGQKDIPWELDRGEISG